MFPKACGLIVSQYGPRDVHVRCLFSRELRHILAGRERRGARISQLSVAWDETLEELGALVGGEPRATSDGEAKSAQKEEERGE